MSSINVATRELAIKLVYYGPGLGGKTASLQHIHRALRPDTRGQLISLATGADRTLYFDFLPVEFAIASGFTVRVHLYTVPGQVHYDATRKLVLNGCDGVVFVADSQREREPATVESFQNLRENLQEQGRDLDKLPLVFAYNKRDCPDVLAVDELEQLLNGTRRPAFETVATSGQGVLEVLKSITTAVVKDVRRQSSPETVTPTRTGAAWGATWTLGGGRRAPSGAFDEALDEEHHTTSAVASDAILELSRQEDSNASGALGEALKLTPLSPGAGVLAALVPAGAAREQVAALEAEIAAGDCLGAVHRAGQILEDRIAAVRALDPDAGPAAVALFHRVQPERYTRMRELLRRAAAGAVSSDDAAFALFFSVDLLLTC